MTQRLTAAFRAILAVCILTFIKFANSSSVASQQSWSESVDQLTPTLPKAFAPPHIHFRPHIDGYHVVWWGGKLKGYFLNKKTLSC